MKAKTPYLQVWADSLDGRNGFDITLFFNFLKLDRLEKEIRNRMNPVRSLAFNKKLLFFTKTMEKNCLLLDAVTSLSKSLS